MPPGYTFRFFVEAANKYNLEKDTDTSYRPIIHIIYPSLSLERNKTKERGIHAIKKNN